MADHLRHRDADEGSGAGPDREATTSTPRWVKAFGISALVLGLLFVVVMLSGGAGGHGPARHAPSEASGGHGPSAGRQAPRLP